MSVKQLTVPSTDEPTVHRGVTGDPPGRSVCATCGRVFTGGERFCPFDRTDLNVTPAPASEDPLVGTVLGGSYTLLSRLGGGGMGVVYRARQNRLQRDVALKILSQQLGADDRARERFRTEALAVSQLSNPHTVAIHDFGSTEQGLLYLVMALLEGESLRNRLQKGPLGIRSAVNIGAQIAESLAEAHARKPQIIHRDIKPDNIVIRAQSDGEDFATVLDFGLAKLASSSSDRLTATGLIVGTPAYMAPEQARGDVKVDARVDLYALGVVLHEMVSGRQPFVAENPTALLYKHVWDPPPTLSECCPGRDVPPELEQIVLSLLAKNPDDRPASASIVRTRLLEIFRRRSSASISIPPPTPASVTRVAPTLMESAPDLGKPNPGTAIPGDSLFSTTPAPIESPLPPPQNEAAAPAEQGFESDIAAGIPAPAKRTWLVPVGLAIVGLAALGAWMALARPHQPATEAQEAPRSPAPIAAPAPVPAPAPLPPPAVGAPAPSPVTPALAAPAPEPTPAPPATLEPARVRPRPSIATPPPAKSSSPAAKPAERSRTRAPASRPAKKDEGDFPEVPE